MSMRDDLTKMLEPYTELLDVSSIEAMALRILGAALILLIGFWISRTVRIFLVRRLQGHDSEHESAARSYCRFARIAVMTTAISLAIHTLGIDLTHWFIGGGLLAVAFAFALKNVSENLVSGLILRLERAIKHGDVLYTHDGQEVKVNTIGLRATIVRTKNEGELIIPNAELVQNQVSNYTYRDSLHRLETIIGVAYSSDLKQVRSVLEQTCNDLDWGSEQYQPQVQLIEFGDSAVNFKVLVWIEDPWISGRLKSDLNEAIWWALKEAGIDIPFPQRDVHLIQEASTSEE